MKRYYFANDVRQALEKALAVKKQREVAEAAGVPFQQVSLAHHGAPIPSKLAAWLGFRKVTDIYERIGD